MVSTELWEMRRWAIFYLQTSEVLGTALIESRTRGKILTESDSVNLQNLGGFVKLGLLLLKEPYRTGPVQM